MIYQMDNLIVADALYLKIVSVAALLAAGCIGCSLGIRWGERRERMRWQDIPEPWRIGGFSVDMDDPSDKAQNRWDAPIFSQRANDHSGSCHADAAAATTRADSPACNRDG